ncbi:MAG TPA: sugar ABC transporter substrate-binding protein [Conexibacter sp.]|nr:sugar ABC transporter substrate-binding protein [Conexibacter sp.]
MRKFPLSVALVGAVLALAAAGCGSGGSSGGGSTSGGAGGKHETIAASLYSRDVPFYQAIAQGLQEQAKAYGWTLKLVFSNPDPSQQIDAINTLLAQQPNALVIVPIDSSGLVPAGKQALAQKVPVVALGDHLSDPSAETTYVGGDFKQYGVTKAAWIAKQLHGRGTVGIVHGIRGLTFTEEQWKGAQQEFAKHPGITVVNGPYAGNFTADLGLTATQNLLTAHPNLNAIFFDNDDLALGGARAIADRGLQGKVLTVGTDGLQAGLSGVRAGQISYTLSQCAVGQGKQAMRTLHDMLVDGKQPGARVITKTIEITKANIAQFSGSAAC